MNDVLTAVAKADQPAATFQALAALVDAQIGARLFTVLQIDQDRAVLRRAYSNMPQAYPVGGEKPLHDTDWSRHLLDRKEPFVAQNRAELAQVFPDHELIQSLGCESCLNVPVVIAGRVAGTLNCLHDAGHYTPARVADAAALVGPGAVALLMAGPFPP